MTTTIMATHVEAFLVERQALGFRTTGPSASQLRSFARFFDGAGHAGSLTPDLVIEYCRGAGRNEEAEAFATLLARLRNDR